MNAFMQLAIREAETGIRNGDGGPFGAVIVKDGVVIALAHNQVIAKQDPTCHGEIEAIRSACQKLGTFDLTGCEIYTTSEPCPMCKCAIMWANIEKVYYGCTVQDAEQVGFRDVEFATSETPSEQLDRLSCIQLFQEYESLNPTKY